MRGEYHIKLEQVYDYFFTEHGEELAIKRQKISKDFYNSLMNELMESYEGAVPSHNKLRTIPIAPDTSSLSASNNIFASILSGTLPVPNSRKAAIFCELYRFGDEILKELCIQDGVVRDTHQELAYEDISNLTCDEILENYLADCMVQVRSMFRSGFNGWDPVAGFISDKDLNTVFAIVYRQYLFNK